MDEAGNPIYHQAEISDTLDALLDGSLTLEEVDQFVNNHISDAERRLTESGKKAPVMELDIDGYKARKKSGKKGGSLSNRKRAIGKILNQNCRMPV